MGHNQALRVGQFSMQILGQFWVQINTVTYRGVIDEVEVGPVHRNDSIPSAAHGVHHELIDVDDFVVLPESLAILRIRPLHTLGSAQIRPHHVQKAGASRCPGAMGPKNQDLHG